MPDSKKDPSLRSSGALPSDDSAPISEPRPSSPEPDASLLGFGASSNDAAVPLPPDSGSFPVDDAPKADDDAGETVTRALTNAFLAKKTTQDRIREVVEARVPTRTQAADVENLVQTANERALATTSLARSVKGMRPWVSRIAQNTVIDGCRENGVQLKWVDRSIDVQELPPDEAYDAAEHEVPADDPTAPPRPVKESDEDRLLRWLRSNVKSKADRATLEMIVTKGASGKTNAEVAAEFGLSEDAFDARIRRFRMKWQPQWKRAEEQRNRTMLLILGAAAIVLAVVAWWLLHRKHVEPIGPTTVPLLVPVPSATVSAAPVENRLNQALPPEDGGRLKP